jgi:ElaB/YqjD/DUF883 family membrane-anchored ribosome-binding protein
LTGLTFKNPWKSLAIATSIGFLLALLMRR